MGEISLNPKKDLKSKLFSPIFSTFFPPCNLSFFSSKLSSPFFPPSFFSLFALSHLKSDCSTTSSRDTHRSSRAKMRASWQALNWVKLFSWMQPSKSRAISCWHSTQGTEFGALLDGEYEISWMGIYGSPQSNIIIQHYQAWIINYESSTIVNNHRYIY